MNLREQRQRVRDPGTINSSKTCIMASSSKTAIPNLFSVEGKVCIVTGGGTGIGYMISSSLAENGAKVYIVGRRQEKLDEAIARYNASGFSGDGQVLALQGDVANKATIAALVKKYEGMESKLDVLVNCAGIHIKDPKKCDPDDTEQLLETLWSSEWESWEQVMATNVSALYFTTVGFGHLLRAAYLAEPSSEERPKEWPSVINIGSIGGLHNSRTTANTSYQTAKAAVVFLTKVMATRFTPLHVRVNCIAPGLFPSELTATADQLRKFDPDQFKAMPEGRAGSPPDIAGPTIFLASRGGAYLNGVTLDVGGGRTLVVSGLVNRNPDA